MSIFDDWNRMAKENRAKYPPGTRILLLGMDDPHHPVPPGTRGTVDHVDDGGIGDRTKAQRPASPNTVGQGLMAKLHDPIHPL